MSYSFIIPIYNTYISEIEKCINSILNQKLNNYEIILINDGSTNKELNDYCKNELTKIPNLIYKYEKNSGSAVARNLGIKLARKDYIVFIDADDELEKDFFKKINNINLSDITVFDYCNVGNNKKTYFKNTKNLINNKSDIYANICFYPGKMNDFMFGSIWGKIFSRKFINKNNILFISNLRKAQDRVFMLHAISKTSDLKYYPILMYNYKLNQKSITHKMNLKMFDYYNYLYEEILQFSKKEKLNNNETLFLSYNIMNELLPLTIFNINYKKDYKIIKKELLLLIKKYNINNQIKNIKYKYIPTKKGKIKLFLYKNKFYYILYKYFQYLQIKENKNLF